MEQARIWLNNAASVAVLTGAGISAESGVPTFRGKGGFWKQFRAEELATPEAFAQNPKLVWGWYSWRRNLIAKTEPNPGHFALAELEGKKSCFTLVTQNVDGLHDRAGSRKVLKLHGDIWTLRCTDCHQEDRDERLEFPELPPRCSCGGMLRPGVVWFGEALPWETFQKSEEAVSKADVLLVVGTSAAVYPAAGLIPLAKSAGAKVIEINPDETPLSSLLDCSLRGNAGDLLPRLIK